MKIKLIALVLALACSPAFAQSAVPPPSSVGQFTGHQDIGIAPAAGNTTYDPATQSFTVTGGGNNVWLKADAFQYAWQQLSGDFSLSADIAFLDNTTGTSDAHRKGMLMIRQDLDAGSAYVDVARHGDGLTSLQARDTKDDNTHEIRVAAPGHGPQRLKIEKRGDVITVFIADKPGDPFHFSGASYILKFQGPVYVGLGVGAHNGNDTSKNLESVVFSHVELSTHLVSTPPKLYTTIETQPVTNAGGGDRSVLYTLQGAAAGPLWLPDNSGIIFSSGGKLYRLPMTVPAVVRGAATSGNPPIAAGEQVAIATGNLDAIDGAQSLSPDGTQIILVNHPAGQPSAVYSVPLAGGTPQKLAPNTGIGSSMSSDGKTLVVAQEANGQIYAVPADGSTAAILLTSGTTTGHNFSPQFSADGKSIIFCSDRSGLMQIWRMNADGTAPTQLTNDENNNGFPRIARNGNSILFISAPKNTAWDGNNASVSIRRLLLNANGPAATLAQILGGRGSAPGFAPNNTSVIYMEYQLVY